MSPTAEHTYGSRRGVTLIELLVAMAIFIAV
ncbi:MAG: prepilin-type N-terminal cleavage/methylation domain-containing protein, partial [Candidatus Hydrogenedentes bacterium]|nr:prepilin-type N-terminal cleavage/methylation domain-containing protein [Candidatus Hydrogenedentota bacterium]